MQLRLSHLRSEATHAVERTRAVADLGSELRRVLGPTVPVRGTLAHMVEAVHARLDELGPHAGQGARASVLLKFVDDPSRDVRRLAARLLPPRLAERLGRDPDPGVRRAARLRSLCEGDDEPGTRLTGDAVKQHEGPELSDGYYRSLAERLMQDFGRRMEFGWEPVAVRRLAGSTRALSGIVIDEERLLEALDDLRTEREEETLERPDRYLREAAGFLRRRAVAETPVMPLIEEHDSDPVARLDERASGFKADVERVFRIRSAPPSSTVQRGRLREGVDSGLRVPVVGRLPHGGAPRALDERALDSYVRAWNGRAAATGEPTRISWSPGTADRIVFSAEVK